MVSPEIAVLAQARRDLNLSFADLARRAGLNQKVVFDCLRGRTDPRLSTVRRIAQAVESAKAERAAASPAA